MASVATKRAGKTAAKNSSALQNSRPGPELGGSGTIQDHLRQLAREVMSEISGLTPSHSDSAELMGIFVSELFLLATEQRQRETRSRKQLEVIAAAKARGVRFGPQPRIMPDGFEELRQAWRSKKIPLSVAAELCGVPRSTFYDAALRSEMAANPTQAE